VSLPELDEMPPLVGKAWLVGDRVSAAQIIRVVQAATVRSRRGGRDASPLTFARGDFVVAGVDVGAGEGSAPEVELLRSAGVAALIGRSFSPLFYRAVIEAGVPALVIEETGAVKLGDRLRVDVEEHKIANLSSGDRYIIRNLYDDGLDILRAGGLAEYRARQTAQAGGRHQ
jgi:3-isopropylmalate dehydratase small subunit